MKVPQVVVGSPMIFRTDFFRRGLLDFRMRWMASRTPMHRSGRPLWSEGLSVDFSTRLGSGWDRTVLGTCEKARPMIDLWYYRPTYHNIPIYQNFIEFLSPGMSWPGVWGPWSSSCPAWNQRLLRVECWSFSSKWCRTSISVVSAVCLTLW